ncbi:MAG: cytochrome c oxidase subunit 3 family protein [Bacteroidota bacterium]|nr:cytochrome c oxidase subunit 3 family protein [Bacteroidota bacterium]
MSSTAHTHVAHRDDYGSRMGMWLFLFTELILFGGLFIVYAVYRYMHQQEFHLAAQELNTTIGMLNTIILLTSSMTAAMSITALQKGNVRFSMSLIVVTILFAGTFMVNKFFEWSAKIHHGIYPGSKELVMRPEGEILYFGLYYVMTGLHALHVIVGVTIFVFVLVFMKTGTVNQTAYVKLENAALYWHLVDLIWIFLFPLFYLIH